MRNNKGSLYLDVVTGILIIGILTTILYRFNAYSINLVISSNQNLKTIEVINNKITDLYNIEDWASLDTERIDLKDNVIEIIFSYEPETEYDTERLNVEFIVNDVIKEYMLERSIVKKS